METIILITITVLALYHILTANNLQELQDEPYYFILETPDFTQEHKRGYGNGYVRVSNKHPLFGKSNSGGYNQDGNYSYGDPYINSLDVHGGITWCGSIRRSEEYVFGFDCSHLGDNKINCNAEYLHSECKKLLAQIKNIK